MVCRGIILEWFSYTTIFDKNPSILLKHKKTSKFGEESRKYASDDTRSANTLTFMEMSAIRNHIMISLQRIRWVKPNRINTS